MTAAECIACGKPFEPWQRVTPGPRHGACNPEAQRAERDWLLGRVNRSAGDAVQAELFDLAFDIGGDAR